MDVKDSKKVHGEPATDLRQPGSPSEPSRCWHRQRRLCALLSRRSLPAIRLQLFHSPPTCQSANFDRNIGLWQTGKLLTCRERNKMIGTWKAVNTMCEKRKC